VHTTAVILSGPRTLGLETVALKAPGSGDLVVEIAHSGISTGTEKLFWSGTMPPFPGMGYPLVPGYESAGEVVEAGADTNYRVGDRVFVPGANCYEGAFGLFGGSTRRLVTAADRVTKIDAGLGAEGALLALAATARHAMAGMDKAPPDLIVGHGVLGRLLARLTVAAGAPAPTVWEIDADRAQGAMGYEVIHPDADTRRDYGSIYDASGNAGLLNKLIGHIRKGGEIVLAGFYTDAISFAFPPAFMKEARLRIAAEWDRSDLTATRALIESGALSLWRPHHPHGGGFGRGGGLRDGLLRSGLPQDDPRLERPGMTLDIPNLKDFDQRLRDEAHEEPTLEVPQSEPTKKTQIIAIYGKGGIGKSFTLANLSHMMAEMGKRVLLIGCDPKSDTTSLLFGGKACPTIIETSTRKKLAGEEVKIGDVCFKRGGVFAMELGGPEVGRGCGGRGIIHGFELLEKLGFHDWDFDYVLLDFLGDVVCGGFGLPIARDMAQKVILVASNDLQSLYVANNVCSAVEYFRRLGGNVGVAGLVINKDDGTGEAAAFAKAVNIPVLAAIPQDDDLRKKSANYQIVGTAQSQWGDLFAVLADAVAIAPPVRPAPLDQDGLLNLFDSKQTGGDFVLVPATDMDMRGKNAEPKKSLEVVYDDV
jgi:3,8-divinyl chlorophyllide a/chlorophyllide a reductase subunit X